MCGLYGNNGKFNVTNGSSGPNGLYRLSGQREWGINWRHSYEQSENAKRFCEMVALRSSVKYHDVFYTVSTRKFHRGFV